MTKKVSSKPREDLKPRPVPVAKKMRPYVSRIKLRANEPSGSAELKAVKVMTDILDKKKIPAVEAAQAIREARDAAATHQLEGWRSVNRRTAATGALKDLDELILKTEGLGDAISALPLRSKGHLNRKTAHLVKEGIFDADMFVDLIDLLMDCLPDLLPPKKADDVRCLIERHEGENSPRIVRLWESIPWIARDCVERRIRKIKNSPSWSCVKLLRVLPKLLDQKDFRSSRRGAPRFLLREYVKEIDLIWLRLNLMGRRQYDANNDRHVQSLFQKFCNAALNSVGDPTEISIRQVSDLKRRRPPKRKPRSSN